MRHFRALQRLRALMNEQSPERSPMSTTEPPPVDSTSERLLAERLEEVTARIRHGEPLDLGIYEQEDRNLRCGTRSVSHRRKSNNGRKGVSAVLSRGGFAAKAQPQESEERPAAVPLAPTHADSLGHAHPAPTLPDVRDYEVLGLIGSGGMARVYKARHRSTGQLVAIKMLHTSRLGNPADVQRFKREASRIKHLRHPHIVKILDTGLEAEPPYFCMELVRGQGLNQCLEGFVSDPRDAARVVKSIAETVHYANERGILHRDLKPRNVILDEKGQPHLTDFGLARAEEDSELTRTNDILGTPAYMAPEQAAGTPRDVTNRTDVYGVRAILYALITGRAPFESNSPREMLRIVQFQRPRNPSELNGRVESDLATICVKCLEKRPFRRYESAAAVAEELGRFLKGKHILARSPNAPTQAFRWGQDHPRIVATCIIVLAVLSVVFWQRTRQLEAEARNRELVIAKAGLEGAAREAELAQARAEVRNRELVIAKAKSEAAAREAELAQAKAEARTREAQIRERDEASRRTESEARELVSNPTTGSRWVALERIRKAVALAPAAKDLTELRSLATTILGSVDLKRLKNLDLGTDLLDRIASRQSTNCLAFDTRGGRVAIGQEHGAGAVFVRVYDTRTQKKLQEYSVIHGGRTSQGGVRGARLQPRPRWTLACRGAEGREGLLMGFARGRACHTRR